MLIKADPLKTPAKKLNVHHLKQIEKVKLKKCLPNKLILTLINKTIFSCYLN